MAYASQSHIEMAAGGPERLVELADWNNDGVADTGVITEAQRSADGWIDSYARARFATPIATPSDTLIRVAAEEAIYWIRKQRGMASDDHRKDHAEREQWCKDLAAGKVRPDEPLPTRSTAIRSQYVSHETRTVSRERTKGFW